MPRGTYRDLGLGLPYFLATFVSATVLASGIPALRHDWRIPSQADAVGPLLASLFQPWLSNGIGSAQPYPTFYLIGLMLWPLHFVGAFAVILLIVFATVALTARAAMQLVRRLGASSWTTVAAGLFATLNPWVYSKYVAGHILMIFAYAVWLALLAEIVRRRPRQWILIVLSALSVTQIEFFAVGVVPLLVWLIARKQYKALAALAAAATPILYGIVATYSQIRATPFNLSWQDSQSLQPVQALLLTGYVFDYAHAFNAVWPASLAFLLAALTGVVSAPYDGRNALVAAAGFAGYLFTTGTKGPIAPLYRSAVIHFPEIGLFRELYDLIALLLIVYLALLARGAGRHRVVGIALTLAAAGYLVPWLAVPPAAFAVGSPHIPKANVPAFASERVAFLPAFQPLTFDGRGSGVDPDAYVRDGHAVPLNEFFPTYPVDAALGYASVEADDRYLAALSVTSLVVRPYLQSNFDALKYQWIETKSFRLPQRESRSLAALPLLSMTGTPGVAAIGNRPDESSVFFGDLAPAMVHTFEPSRASNDPAAGWVDARLAIPLRPEWGTSFGGVMTRSTGALALPMAAATTSLLAHADGVLVDDLGRVVVRRERGIRWWPLAASARSVHCNGTCVVILQGVVPPGLPEHRPLLSAKPLQVRFTMPWLASADVPAHFKGTLRLNVRYDGAWAAYFGGKELHHLRLDTALNGWNVETSGRTRIAFVQRTAAVQFTLELFALLLVILLLAGEVWLSSASRKAPLKTLVQHGL